MLCHCIGRGAAESLVLHRWRSPSLPLVKRRVLSSTDSSGVTGCQGSTVNSTVQPGEEEVEQHY